MARTKALGGWLNDSRGKEKRKSVLGSNREREKLQIHLFLWKLRGLLWFMTLAVVLVTHSTGAPTHSQTYNHCSHFRLAVVMRWHFPDGLGHVRPALPAIVLCSLFWTAWDPTYYSFRKARIQGRDLRVRGKKTYIVRPYSQSLFYFLLIPHQILQMIAWSSRLFSSVLLALSWHSPSQDYLHLSRYPATLRTHYYCLISLTVELLVSIDYVPCHFRVHNATCD